MIGFERRTVIAGGLTLAACGAGDAMYGLIGKMIAKPGQRVIIVAGVPLGTPGATNMLRIAFVSAEASNQ